MNSRKAAAVAALLLVSCAENGDTHEHSHGDLGPIFDEAYAVDDVIKGIGDGLSCSGIAFPDQEGLRGRVVLTFDDGPNMATTPEIVEYLREQNIPATFFMNGNRIEGHEDFVRDLVDDPLFIVANHTETHPRRLPSQSDEFIRAQIEDTADRIRAVGGDPAYFRFPFGLSNCKTAEIVWEHGYHITGWHVDTGDWCFANGRGTCGWDGVPSGYSNDMLGWTMRQVRNDNGGVILMHDIHAYTRDFVPTLVESLRAEGYTFTNMDDTRAFPRLHGVEPVAGYIGDTCRDDYDCTWDDENAFCHGSGVCTQYCAGSCPDTADGHQPNRCLGGWDGWASNHCIALASPLNSYCEDIPTSEFTWAEVYSFTPEQAMEVHPSPPESDWFCLPTQTLEEHEAFEEFLENIGRD